jgi:acyl-homoserine lactone synthase
MAMRRHIALEAPLRDVAAMHAHRRSRKHVHTLSARQTMIEVHVVHSRFNPAYQPQIDDMFRQRYDVFVRRLGWDIPGTDHQYGREIDAFDGPGTVYLIVLDGDAVLGASRLLPSTGPTLMRGVFAALCPEGAPESPDIWEWSRGHVRPDQPPQARSAVLDHIFVSGYEFALGSGITGLTAQVNAAEFPRWLRRGLMVDVLGPPVPFGDNPLVALRHKVTPATVSRVRSATGIRRPVLAYPRRPDSRRARARRRLRI